MPDIATTLPLILRPDATRTVIRPFTVGDPDGFVDPARSRSQRIIDRVLALDDAALRKELEVVMQSLDSRHRDVEAMLLERSATLEDAKVDRDSLSRDQAVLIGAYFSEEFSFESAALFNPSIVRDPDTSGAAPGDLKFIMSLRGIGEGHVSSLTFRTGVWKADGDVVVNDPSPRAVGPKIEESELANGERLIRLSCGDQSISETVIFPFLPSQGRGIEDVRLVEFAEDDGETDYRGTFTAFSGEVVREVLLRTPDFKTFEMRGVEGPYARAKGMALFPRRIDGCYYMLGRQDNESVWLMSSDDPHVWKGGEKLLSPEQPWEFVQMGNCGSPIEIEEGWLVLTHGVGVVRNYCVGAALLDKADPSRVLGRLKTPLLQPNDKERDGYVPNVVYSCGGLLRDRTLLLPYGVADNFTAFATVSIDALVAAIL